MCKKLCFGNSSLEGNNDLGHVPTSVSVSRLCAAAAIQHLNECEIASLHKYAQKTRRCVCVCVCVSVQICVWQYGSIDWKLAASSENSIHKISPPHSAF